MITEYLIVFLVVFVANIIPAFMPPTWSLLSLFAIFYDLPPLELTIIGAVSSSLGRYVLASYSRPLADKFLPKKQKKNIKYLRNFLRYENNELPFIIALLYALGPFPSNTLFIVSGAAHISVRWILAGFFVGRLVSYGLLVTIAKGVISSVSIEQLFTLPYLLLDAAGLLLAIAILFVNWQQLVYSLIEREKTRRIEEGMKSIFGETKK